MLPATAMLLAILAVACGRSYDSAGLSREGLTALAEEAYDNGDYRQSADLFLELIYRFPGSSDIDYHLYMLGLANAGVHAWSDAEFYLGRVLEDHPRSAFADDSYLELARVFWRQRRDYRKDQTPVQNALLEIQALMETYPGTSLMPEVTALRDSCYEQMARRAVFVGEFYARRELYQAALLYLRDAITSYGVTSAFPAALLDLGDVYVEMGDRDRASDFYQRALDEFDLDDDQLRRAEEGLGLRR